MQAVQTQAFVSMNQVGAEEAEVLEQGDTQAARYLALVSDSILQSLLERQAVHTSKGSCLHEVWGNTLRELPLTHLLETATNLQSHSNSPHCQTTACSSNKILRASPLHKLESFSIAPTGSQGSRVRMQTLEQER